MYLRRYSDECDCAADKLQLPDEISQLTFSGPSETRHPPGCYFKPDNDGSSRLWFDDSGASGSCDGTRNCLCRESCPIASVTGQWKPIKYSNGEQEVEYTVQTTRTMEQETTEQWSREVSVAVSKGFDVPLIGDVNVEVTGTFAESSSERVLEAIEMMVQRFQQALCRRVLQRVQRPGRPHVSPWFLPA